MKKTLLITALLFLVSCILNVLLWKENVHLKFVIDLKEASFKSISGKAVENVGISFVGIDEQCKLIADLEGLKK